MTKIHKIKINFWIRLIYRFALWLLQNMTITYFIKGETGIYIDGKSIGKEKKWMNISIIFNKLPKL